LQYPEKAKKANITGIVELSCVVNIDGSLSELKVTKPLGYGCNEEALRLVSEAKNWNVAFMFDRDENWKYHERPVRQRITIKIPFNL
jgi:protein TonB